MHLITNLLTISAYCQIIGLHPQTLRKLERLGRSTYVTPIRTQGGHRRYIIEAKSKGLLGYARVSCADQKDDLPRQIDKLNAHATLLKQPITVFKDIGSGLNCKKAGLTQLVKTLLTGKISELVLTYKDRLLRFGSEIIFLICKQMGVKVTILQEAIVKDSNQTFCEDVLSIITVFSAKLYGARSHINRKNKLKTQVSSI